MNVLGLRNVSTTAPKWQRKALMKKEAEEYFAIHKSERHPLVKKYHKSKHFLKWAIKLLVPDFLIGYPNLWDNLKLLRKHPRFKPFRMAFVAWMIFALVMGSSGIYILINASQVKAADAWYDPGWGDWLYRKKITFNNADQVENLANFPVLVKLDKDIDIDYAKTKNAGEDIRFTDSDGITLLKYEIEKWDETATSTVWVKVPQIDASSATDYIYMYYKNAEAGDVQDAPNVWNNNYVMVQHLEETDIDGGAGDIKDSTANGKNGTTVEMNAADQVAGKIDGSFDFDGAGDYVKLGATMGLGTSALTGEVWYKGTQYANYIGLIGESNSADGWGLENHIGILRGFLPSLDSNRVINNGVWHYLVYTRSSAAAYLYIDGVLDKTGAGSVTNVNSSINDFWIGGWGNTAYLIVGLIDEVRISNSARSAAWIAASYKSESDTFNTFGDEETGNRSPDTPTNLSPVNGAVNQSLTPTLTSSAFSDPDVGDAHLASQWQVTATAGNYAAPVYDSNATTTALTTITIPADILNASTTYYWHVRHKDNREMTNSWSLYSAETSFITSHTPATPSNYSPANGVLNQKITPTLTASAFSDTDEGSVHSASQWLVRNLSDPTYATPVYDSGDDAINKVSLVVPAGKLAKNTTYFWKARYKDDTGLWSAYSAETAFTVGVTPVTVIAVGATEYTAGETAKLTVQVKDADGSPINTATTTITIYNPAGEKVVNWAAMNYLATSNGLYIYSYIVPATSGVYIYEVKAVSADGTAYSSHTFHNAQFTSDITSIKSTTEAEQTAQTAERATQSAERILQEASRVKVEEIQATTTDIQTKVTDIQTKVTNIQSNMDILIGALIVTQSTVNDISASTTAFITPLTNSTDNFYKNAVLTFTSGNLDGQSRRVSGYNGSTKQVTLDPALTSAPANGDAFTIVTQNVRVEEQVAGHETAQAAFRADTTSRLTSIEGKIDTITANLNTVDANLDSVLSIVNSIRTSQQKGYKVTLSDVSEIQASSTYRAKLTILDFESNPKDASSTPTILIYDATRAIAQATTTMTWLSTGVYGYTASVSASSTTGLWETIVNVALGGTADITRNDYWQVTGAPAQVVINSMSDLTVPSIAANVTITNEGNAAFEYKYEWCVVSSQTNQCGGNDDVYYGSAAKLIAVGDSFNPTLTATVPAIGNYWFKVVVYYGTEASGASRTFTAITAAEAVAPSPGGGGTAAPSLATTENIYSEIIKARNQLDLNSQKLAKTLEILGIVSPAMSSLLSVNTLNTENLIDVQNKVADLQAVSAATRRIVEQKTVEPIVETYMKFNSVEINFLITNPDSSQQVVKFKAFLPEEAKPEHILDLSGLKVDYDTNAKVYYVSGDITLGPKETVTRRVEMKDIWVFGPEEIKSIKDQANGLILTFAKTQYEAQGAILKNDIDSTLNIILLRQEESYSSPQDHIVAYRENKERMARAENNLEKLKDLVVQAGASRGVVGQVGGIQTFATWGIILAIVFGFGLLAAVIFAMWRHQTMLAAAAMGMPRSQVMAQFGGAVRRRNKASKKRQKTSFIWNLPWKKILIWVVALAIALILVIVSVKFAPMIFSSKEMQFENKEAPAAPQEKLIGSKLIPETQENVKVVFSNGEDEKKLKITNTPTGWLNVRDAASLSGKTIGKVYPGDEYEYTDEKNGWYEIILKDKTEGWIFGSYVEKIQN